MIINMDAFRQGEKQQFTIVFNRYHAQLCRFAARFLHDRPAAEDMVTDSFMALWQQHAVIKSEDHLQAFLYLGVRNACINHRRALQVRQKAHREIGYWNNGKAVDPHQLLVGAEELCILIAAAGKLPPRTAEVFRMAYLENRPAKAIACKLGITRKSVLNERRKGVNLLKEKWRLFDRKPAFTSTAFS